jgi:hypothetical protein
MVRAAIALLLTLVMSWSFAGTFICSKVFPPSSLLDRTGKSKRTYYTITQSDLVQAYSAKPVFLGDAWLTVVMMPLETASTKAAYDELGISTDPVYKALKYNSLVDIKITFVQTESQLIDAVEENPPAVGYTTLFVGRNGPAPCFQ